MNPGYAGRTELPDNLKVLFRPVSMMIPDYSMIAEIMLMAEGFHEASRLSKKIVQLYKLANEQLSSQFHYDFGLRALKSVLLTAGDIRRKLEETAEENILIQAMNESNIPKLVQKDVLLFKALVQDLFPGVSLPKVQNESFLELIKADLMKKGLQGPEGFIRKVFELADTMSVRYGSMLVGPAMSGKSTLIRTLSTCKGTSLSVLNPKSITIGELYGDMNHLTQDWKDGLASSIFREITNGPNPELRWVVFDGPVDSLWIESMNTVLDDNMMLCLPNGERIKLKPSMRILFEVADLSKASPATVSRCGMVYIPHDNLTWNMLATSWLEQLEGKELKEVLQNMFANILPLVFRAFDAENDMIPSSEIHKVRCLCNILTVMLKNKPKVKYLHSVFAFACIWSLGVLLDSSKHERVSFK
jgi:dynein heavy chain